MTNLTTGIATGAKKITHQVAKNSPTILTGMAIAGLIGTVVLAVKATPKAIQLLKDEEQYLASMDMKMEPLDVVKTAWKQYIPSALLGSATIAFIVGANSIHIRRSAALAGVYTLTKDAFDNYRANVIKTIGEKKEVEIKDNIAKEQISKVPASTSTIYVTDDGDCLFFDPLSGRYFRSDIETVRRVENQMNHKLLSEMWVSLNEFYAELGLSGIELGHDIGWSVDTLIDIIYGTQLTDDGRPCVVLNYQLSPEFYSGSSFG
jgi:hypothetical protein